MKQREWYRVTRDEADSIDIDIYGDIGESRDWWTGEKEGVGAKSFLDTLRGAKGKAVNLHINSGGGSVIDAYAMMTAISNHDGKVTAYIDGLAASAASFLVAAADEVVMSSVAWMMIHNASAFCWGNAEEMRAQAEYLEKVDAQIRGIYARRSATRDEADFARAMGETTWFTADDALEWGLVDRIEESVAAAACATEDRATRQSAPDDVLRMLQGGTCVARVLDNALQVERNGATLALFSSPAACDTSANIPNDEDEPAAQEPAAAQERAVVINGKLCKVKERGENA